jgi:TetR/AcrR family transcriptional repressor of nem operon
MPVEIHATSPETRCAAAGERGRRYCRTNISGSMVQPGQLLTDQSITAINGLMARPREFDREEALERATAVFWAKGYASTSTDDLLTAMGIARQSLYNAFGDKRALYLEALERYQRTTIAGHLQRLNGAASAIAGVEALLLGLISKNDDIRALGCMGVGAICEFGSTDPDIAALRAKVSPALRSRLTERLKEGQAAGEIDRSLDCATAASFIQLTMQGIQLAARGGIDATSLRAQARFVVKRLKSR